MPRFEMKPDLNLRSVSISGDAKREILDRVSMVGDMEGPLHPSSCRSLVASKLISCKISK
jgi:hypothetical protein